MMETGTSTRFGIVRHAPTTWNAARRIQGHGDSPLTMQGRGQARRWAELLQPFPWRRILTSDLGRARETAAIVQAFLDLPLTVDPRLREQHWGDWAGMTFGELREAFPEDAREMALYGWTFTPPGGENRLAVFQRGTDALAAAARRWPGETILVVTHEGMIKSLVYRLARRLPGGPEVFLLQPGHLHWLCAENGSIAIERVNAVALG